MDSGQPLRGFRNDEGETFAPLIACKLRRQTSNGYRVVMAALCAAKIAASRNRSARMRSMTSA
jgi:hypothetical protein